MRSRAQTCIVPSATGSTPAAESGQEDEGDDLPPSAYELMQQPNKDAQRVHVRLSVHYRVHSRQMLCVAGSKLPLGWSFISISKVPMTWNSGDVWTCEVELQAGQYVEYKYVILEEQDWTKLENYEAQGLVDIQYRTGRQGKPPDVQLIQRQMSIVCWQAGPNRSLKVPGEAELQELSPGVAIERISPPEGQRIPYAKTVKRPPPEKPDPFEGTWEVLTLDEGGRPLVDRYDMWGWTPPPRKDT